MAQIDENGLFGEVLLRCNASSAGEFGPYPVAGHRPQNCHVAADRDSANALYAL